MAIEDYFTQVIIPSVGIVEKSSYNINEACSILGCTRRTLNRMQQRGDITVAPNRRIYKEEFSSFFNVVFKSRE